MSLHIQHNLKAIYWMLAACLLASLMVTLVRYLSADINVLSMVFWRNVFGLVWFVPWLCKARLKAFETTRMPIHISRAMAGLLGMWLWFYALTLVDLPIAVALSFTAPLLISLLAVFLLGERYSWGRWISLFVGFGGVLVILRPGTEAFDANMLWVIAAIHLWALSSILVRKLSRTEPAIKITFFMVSFMLIPSFLGALLMWQWPQTWQAWLGLAALGALANAFQYSLSTAIAKGEFQVIMPIDFTRLIFTAILAYWAFGQELDSYTFIGAGIITAVAVYGGMRDAMRHRADKKSAETAVL